MTDTTHSNDFWRRCSSCKKAIAFKAVYWVCNVSTCNRKRTALLFCNVSCWDAHVPQMNHRESWAEERKAPSREEWAKMVAAEAEPKKRQPKEALPQAATEASITPAAAPRVILRRSKSE